MNIPISGPDRVAFLAELHDAQAKDACIAYVSLVAQGWRHDEALWVTSGWLRDRTEAVIQDLCEFAQKDAA